MLLGLLKSGSVIIHDTRETELERIHQLMEQYQTVPMDLAEASRCVRIMTAQAVAELLPDCQICITIAA